MPSMVIQNMQEAAQIIRNQLSSLENRIHKQLFVMQQILERQIQFADIHLKARKQVMRVQLQQFLVINFKKRGHFHQRCIEEASIREIHNQKFWFQQIGLLTIQLKELINKIKEQGRKLESTELDLNRWSQRNNNQNGKQIATQVYKIYQNLMEDARKARNMIYHLKEQYSNWIHHQNQMRISFILKWVQRNVSGQWQIEVFSHYLSQYQRIWRTKFMGIKDIYDSSTQEVALLD